MPSNPAPIIAQRDPAVMVFGLVRRGNVIVVRHLPHLAFRLMRRNLLVELERRLRLSEEEMEIDVSFRSLSHSAKILTGKLGG